MDLKLSEIYNQGQSHTKVKPQFFYGENQNSSIWLEDRDPSLIQKWRLSLEGLDNGGLEYCMRNYSKCDEKQLKYF